ncbi:superoxide dismutase [Cu-Zn]-like [Artemia franciscana]|uniref:Superoxide dismutase copper/zinc binding domain-containing protein n=1 Tax=Artemia franciscana TaxID=6661 RepID=A0AA88L9R9_ARTSF|nr:hypothetical protein QYM36_002788 [Artemia franciscana]
MLVFLLFLFGFLKSVVGSPVACYDSSDVSLDCTKEARATIRGIPGYEDIHGEFVFRQQSPCSPVIMTGSIFNLPPGSHGFHVHEYGRPNATCYSGVHFNPFGQVHGGLLDKERHVGDFGNINAFRTKSGRTVAQFAAVDPVISLCGQRSIVGRTLVVHEKRDDLGRGPNLESLKTGNSGKPIGCGVIRRIF